MGSRHRPVHSFGPLLIFCCFLMRPASALPVPEDGRASNGAALNGPAPSPAEVSRAIALAAGYLERACGPDGKFTYKVDIGSGRESSSYDIIRHAGAMYALAMMNRSHPDPEAVASIIRAAKFLRENYVGPSVRPGQQVVWSQPLVESPEGRRSKAREHYAELGGTGLGLVALAAAREVDSNSVPLEQLQALGRFALFLQRDDGSFVHKYRAEGGPVPNWEVLYYPGETALGFIALFEADHSREWLMAAGKALSFLAKSRAGLATVPADHWALIATAKLLPYCEEGRCPASREELVRHAVQVCESILRDQFRGSAPVALDGAFDSTGRTAPAATRLEGLVAAVEFLPKGEFRDKIEAATGRGIAFLLRAQIVSGPEEGGMPGSALTRVLDSSQIRIDYVQHALCAWLRYQRLLRSDVEPRQRLSDLSRLPPTSFAPPPFDGIRVLKEGAHMRCFLLATMLLATWVASERGTSEAQEAKSQSRAPSAKVAPISVNLPSDFELLRTRYRFENDGTGRKEVIGKVRILNAMGVLQQAEETFEYRPPSEELQILYIRVRKEDGTVVNVDTNVVQEPPNGVNPKYDFNERRVRIPGLSVGDLVEYNVAIVIHRPLGPSEFYVAHSFQPSGALDEQLEVDVPKNRVVKVKGITNLRSWETTTGTRRVYHWENRNTRPRQVGEISYVVGRMPDVQVSSFLSWEEVGRWYEDLERSQRAATPEVKAKADELTKGLNSDFEKVEVLYDFVAKRIKYTNLPVSVAGYVPHSAPETLHNQYGDCKDKVALLSALLEALGLHPSLVLTSPDREPDPVIPSPLPFTHVIAMLHLGKEEVWMDPSPAGLPFRILPYPLRGKKGLVIPRDGVPHFEKLPAVSPVSNVWTEEVEAKLQDDGSLEATVNTSVRGDAEVLLRQAFIGPIEPVWPITVQGVIKGIDRRTDKVSDVKISDPTATNEPFRLSFRLTRARFTGRSGQTVKFRLPLQDFDLPTAVEEGVADASGGWHRVESEPVRLGPPGEQSYRFKLELPPGFSPQVPESVSFECSGGTYRATYRSAGSSVTAERVLIFRKDNLPAHLRDEYAAFREKVLQDAGRPISARVTDAQPD